MEAPKNIMKKALLIIYNHILTYQIFYTDKKFSFLSTHRIFTKTDHILYKKGIVRRFNKVEI